MNISNKKAYHEYFIEDEYEAGICLLGTEVKSCIKGKVDLSDGYLDINQNIVKLKNVHIAKYPLRGYVDHEEKRDRILLLNRSEIKKIRKQLDIKGYTAIPLSMYIGEHNKIKLKIGVCKGKKLHDKRQVIKDKQIKRDVQREIKYK